MSLHTSTETLTTAISGLHASVEYTAPHVEKIAAAILSCCPTEPKAAAVYEESDDGHCGFRSLANQLTLLIGRDFGHRDVRALAMKFLEENFEYFVGIGLFSADVLYNKIMANQKALKESTTSVWADAFTLNALATSLKVKIHILYVKSVTLREICPEGEIVAECYLLYWEDIHFDTILYKSFVVDKKLFLKLTDSRRRRASRANSSK